MAVTAFFLGRPGSGKTTAFRHLNTILMRRGWQVTRIREYAILQKMFHNDFAMKRFRPVAHGGFDILDFTVLDEALVELEQQVRDYLKFAPKNEMVVVEFARDNYQTALKPLSQDFLRQTHLLYMDADIETCIQRIQKRVQHNRPNDNHYVSERILRSYYGQDNRAYMQKVAQDNAKRRLLNREQYTVKKQVIQFIDNNGPLTDLEEQVEQFVTDILALTYQQEAHGHPQVKQELAEAQAPYTTGKKGYSLLAKS